jgi:hypothetical protein
MLRRFLLFSRVKVAAIGGVGVVMTGDVGKTLVGGGLVPREEVLAIQSANVAQEKYRARYLSAAFLDCILHFNVAQLNSKDPVKRVECPKQLNHLETSLMKSSLKEAGFNDYEVRSIDCHPFTNRHTQRTDIVLTSAKTEYDTDDTDDNI